MLSVLKKAEFQGCYSALDTHMKVLALSGPLPKEWLGPSLGGSASGLQAQVSAKRKDWSLKTIYDDLCSLCPSLAFEQSASKNSRWVRYQ
jgi:hypothetical protein